MMTKLGADASAVILYTLAGDTRRKFSPGAQHGEQAMLPPAMCVASAPRTDFQKGEAPRVWASATSAVLPALGGLGKALPMLCGVYFFFIDREELFCIDQYAVKP